MGHADKSIFRRSPQALLLQRSSLRASAPSKKRLPSLNSNSFFAGNALRRKDLLRPKSFEARNASHSEGCVPSKKGLREPMMACAVFSSCIKKNSVTMSTSSFTANGVYILSAGLLFLVLSSKNILIYNEELLILLSFIAFVATSAHTMGDSIAETFQSRRDLIQEELQAFFTTKETMLHEVKHQTIMQTALANSMIALGSLVEKELQTLHAQRDMTVKNTVQTHTMTQLQHMMAGEQASYARVHTLSSAAYKFMMIDAYHMDKENMHEQFMENALHLLQNMHKKKMQSKVLARLLTNKNTTKAVAKAKKAAKTLKASKAPKAQAPKAPKAKAPKAKAPKAPKAKAPKTPKKSPKA